MCRSPFAVAIWRSLVLALVCSLLVMPPGAVSAAPGDRDEPVALGDVGTFGDWEIVVDAYEADATETVTGADSFNTEPPAGFQYALATLEITNTGDVLLDPAIELSVAVVGERLVGYTGFSSWCYIGNDLYEVGELAEGDSASFRLCWLVSEADAESLVMNVYGFFSSESEPLWMSLGNDFTVPTEAPAIDADVIDTSTVDEPVAMGDAGLVGDLVMTVDAVKIDAYENLQAYDASFPAPAPGDVYVLVRLDAMYAGEDKGSVAGDLGLTVLDREGETYDTFDNACGGYVPNDGYSVPDLYPGGEAGFNYCIAVPEAEAASLVLQLASYIAFDAEPMFFSLAEG